MFDFDKIFKNKFLRLYFLFGHAFVHIPASTKYSTPRPWSKFSQINSCVKTYAAFRVLFADWTDYLPTTEAFFAFQFNFIIIVFLHCRHEMKYNCCLLFSDFWNELFIWFLVKESVVSQRNSSMVAFETVHAGCYGGQQVKSITGTLKSLSRPNSRLPFKTEMITLEIVTECKLRLLERPTISQFFQLRFVYGIVFIWKWIITVIDATFAVTKRKPEKFQAAKTLRL